MPEPKWMSAKEAAQRLGVCTETVYRLARRGIIRSLTLSRPMQMWREDVEKWAESNWYAERDWANRRRRRPKMRPYRRDGVPLVSDDTFVLCEPYGYMAIQEEKEKIAEWREKFGRGHWDYALKEDWLRDLLNEKRVVTVNEAARILEATPCAVRCLEKRGTLPCIRVGDGKRKRLLFSLDRVEAMAAERAKRIARRGRTPSEWAHDLMRPCIRTKIEAPPNDRLITRKEAADILAVSPGRVGDLVRAGRLFAWQEKPGTHGSKVWLSYNQIMRYAYSWDRVRRRAWQQGRAVPGVDKQELEPGMISNRDHFLEETRLAQRRKSATQRNHGEYFSTAQAARELGISRTCVGILRKRGVLMGYQRRRQLNPDSRGCAWWFYLKEDVRALKDDPEYIERSRRARPRL